MKWEYRVDEYNEWEHTSLAEQEYLDERGELGWELSGVTILHVEEVTIRTKYVYYWKRPIPETSDERLKRLGW